MKTKKQIERRIKSKKKTLQILKTDNEENDWYSKSTPAAIAMVRAEREVGCEIETLEWVLNH